MPVLLRLFLIVLSVCFFVVVIYNVNRKRLQMNYSLIWLTVVTGMLVLAVFPQVLTWIMPLLNIQVASNLVFLLALISLLIISFSLTMIVSSLSKKVRNLTQMMAINQYYNERKTDNREEL